MKKRTTPQELSLLIDELRAGSPAGRDKARRALKRLTGKDLGADATLWREWWGKYANLRCNACGKALFDQELYYLVKASVTSEPAEIRLTEEDLAQDHEAELRSLARGLEGRPADELEDEVFVLLDYYLCAGCKRDYVRRVRRGPR